MRSFISLFSGAGGLDLGLEEAGWDCLFATDNEPLAIGTLAANRGHPLGQGRRAFNDAIIEQVDVRDLSGPDLLARIGRSRGSVRLLAGGPPCQSWSSGGHQQGFDDPRGRLVEDYLRVATEIDTRWLLFENVRGLLTARGRDGVPGSALAYLRAALYQRGWQSKVDLFNAADFGIPQRRVRLILIGYRPGDEPPFPTPTHAERIEPHRARWITLGECLNRLPPPEADEVIRPSGKMALELAGLPPGTGAKSPGKKEATRPGGHWGYKQGAFIADLERPARTITASSQQDWIRDPVLGLRRLTPRECAAIQSFPQEWILKGGRAAQYRLAGNAVPPAFGKALGLALAEVERRQDPAVDGLQTLNPLPARLQSAIEYTLREEHRNGSSRRSFGKRVSISANAASAIL